jgi:hypothetical protein
MGARRILFLLCLAVCATALVGCGGDTLSLDPVANAASKTAETDSARVTFDATVHAGSMGTMSFGGHGIFDGRSKTGWMDMTFDLPAQAQAELGGNPSMEMIFDGRDGLVMYVRSSMFPGVPAETWVKMDLEKLADQEGFDLGALMNANQADPHQALRMLMASSDARPSGSEFVRGVRTTRYSFRVDLDRLADESENLRKSFDEFVRVTGTSSFPGQAWIDAQGRVRKMMIAMSLSSPAAGTMTMELTQELYDFGVRAEIQPPAEQQVVDIAALMGNG